MSKSKEGKKCLVQKMEDNMCLNKQKRLHLTIKVQMLALACENNSSTVTWGGGEWPQEGDGSLLKFFKFLSD